MTLYGIDLVRDQQGKYHLLEINGVCSGMKGFEKIYGDDRVEQQAYRMLQQRYGEITVNDGSYARLQFKKEHPWQYAFFSFFFKFSLVQRLAAPKQSAILDSPEAFSDWLDEKVPLLNVKTTSKKLSFEPYIGQDSVVLNFFFNEELPHPLLNPYVTHEACNNKFFFHQLMKDSEAKEYILPSALIGLGFSHRPDLEEVLEAGRKNFVIKPIMGSLGRGLRFIPRKKAKEYLSSRGPAIFSGIADSTYIEDLVEKGDFEFEYGLALLQPFIDSRKTIEGEEQYTCIRSIICNEKFVDAYMRASSKKKVNLSQGAKAYPCPNKEEVAMLSEKVISVFEDRCVGYDASIFNQELYQQYVEARGRTTKEMRERDRQREMVDMLISTFGRIQQLR